APASHADRAGDPSGAGSLPRRPPRGPLQPRRPCAAALVATRHAGDDQRARPQQGQSALGRRAGRPAAPRPTQELTRGAGYQTARGDQDQTGASRALTNIEASLPWPTLEGRGVRGEALIGSYEPSIGGLDGATSR